MFEQMERCMGAAFGFAVAVVSVTVGSSAGLVCAVVSGLCFGVVVVAQRGLAGRIIEKAKVEHRRVQALEQGASRARHAPARRSSVERSAGRPRPRTRPAPPRHAIAEQQVVQQPVVEETDAPQPVFDADRPSEDLALTADYGW